MNINENYYLFMKNINDFFFDKNDADIKTQSYLKIKSNVHYNDTIYNFLCKKCNNIPIISFIGINTINIECNCSHYINIDIKYITEKNLINEDKELNNKINNSLKCKRHSMLFCAYCDDCSNDICEQCLSEEEEFHSTHTKLFFPNVFEKCKKIIYYVVNEKIENLNDKRIMFKFLNTILYNYREYPCFINYNNLTNCINFLNKLNKKERELYHKENKKKELYIKIRSLRELKDLLNNDVDKNIKIESIIINTQNFYDLNVLKLLNSTLQNSYTHLISLDLKQNNISDIKSLSLIFFPKLINLNLAKNKISNENTENIKNLNINCPKLKKINLSDNAFTKYEIFKCFKSSEHLEIIHIGNNLMNKDLKNIKNKYLNFEFSRNLKELDASYGVFSNKSINIIKYFKFDNLKRLDLSWNNLNSLSFLEKVNCKNLEDIIMSNNCLKEFEELKNYKELKIINLQKNKISDISNLIEFLKGFPNIEIINLIDNNIAINDTENEIIIDKAKKHRNSSNDKILIFF